MAIDQQQVKELLGNGLSVGVVASAVGCTDSYITQLLSDEEFAAEVSRLRIISLAGDKKRDLNIDVIEDRLITKLGNAVEEGAFYKPHDLLRAFSVLNNAKRRASIGSSGDFNQHNTVININIPTPIAKKFTINQQGEVLQVDDQTLVTMPTGQLLKSLAAHTGDVSKYRDVRNKVMPSDISLPYEPPTD